MSSNVLIGNNPSDLSLEIEHAINRAITVLVVNGASSRNTCNNSDNLTPNSDKSSW